MDSTTAHHVPTREPLARATRQGALVTDTDLVLAFGPTCFLASDVVMAFFLPLLSRSPAAADSGGCTLARAATVCRAWSELASRFRARWPACARDVALRLRLAGLGGEEGHDRDYTLYWQQGIRGPPRTMRIYCHNVLSARPVEFVSLHPGTTNSNYSRIPERGAMKRIVSYHEPRVHLTTLFSKLRVDPWTLHVKTDDYTFAKTIGPALKQTYWNGQRRIVHSAVPFATARDGNGTHMRIYHDLYRTTAGEHALTENGSAQMDFRGTSFGLSKEQGQRGEAEVNVDGVEEVNVCGFVARGCSAHGAIMHPSTSSSTGLPDGIIQEVYIVGGGFVGRVAPALDVTRDEQAEGGNYDHEGRNGGWVLPLVLLPTEEEGKEGGTREGKDDGKGETREGTGLMELATAQKKDLVAFGMLDGANIDDGPILNGLQHGWSENVSTVILL